VIACILCVTFFLTTVWMAARSFDRGMTIEELNWALKDSESHHDALLARAKKLGRRWRRRADGANGQKKMWRRRARYNRALVDHLERERVELSQQLHYVTLAYERMVDATYRGRRPGMVLETDLKKKRAPAAFATGAL
jgi:enoyl-CoA hydratase/carnithine racemase